MLWMNRNAIFNNSSVDADAQTFITNAGITDLTQQSAINTLVTSLKTNNLWDKMKAIYPFIGGTATTHKFNLKDPRDLDAAFRLTFSGTFTHSSTGVLNVGNSYANTYFTPSTSLTTGSVSMTFYSRSNTRLASSSTMGVSITAPKELRIILSRTGNSAYCIIGGTNGIKTYTVADSRGLFVLNYLSTVKTFYRNNSALTPTSQSAFSGEGMPTMPVYLFCYNNNGTPAEYDNKECSFSSIGDGLSSTDESNLYTIVQAYQTTLGRQV